MLAVVLTLPAFADTTHTITIDNDQDGHIYEAYQVFAGDLSGDDASGYVLSNVEWGTGVNGAALLAALR